MKMGRIQRAALLLVGLSATPAGAAVTSRAEMVARALEYLEIELQTNEQMDSVCLHQNLDRSEYDVATCGGAPPDSMNSSDFLWHADFLAGEGETFFGWSGMPYAYGSGSAPEQLTIQTAINECAGLGNHECHYNGNGCGWPGCDWSVGVDCSGAVSYAWGISYVGTYALADPQYSVEKADRASLKPGAIFNSPGEHVVLIEKKAGSLVDILEATGNYPVYRRRYDLDMYLAFPSPTYRAFDSKHVADNQVTDGVFGAFLAAGGCARLIWNVQRARDVRWYEFQFRLRGESIWRTFRRENFDRTRVYEAVYTPELGGGAENLIFRVLEVGWNGRRIPYGESRALPPRRRGESSCEPELWQRRSSR